jgi:hypothetical protein
MKSAPLILPFNELLCEVKAKTGGTVSIGTTLAIFDLAIAFRFAIMVRIIPTACSKENQ